MLQGERLRNFWGGTPDINSGFTLTASPAEHIKRAREILVRGRLSEILYAALELRFAVERMAQGDLIFADAASNRMLAEPSPVKKVGALRRMAPASEFAHDIFMINKVTGERHKIGEYKPLDKARVAQIKGRLGDLLHPKDTLMLGDPSEPWYAETRLFLEQSLNYLAEVNDGNSGFFTYEGLDHIEMVIQEPEQEPHG
jgi:hypothetical protein